MQHNEYINTALIDADYVLWIACNPNKVMNEHGVPQRIDNKYVYTPKTLEEAVATCDAYLEDILNLTHADSHVICLTTGVTFRFKMDNSYKANRIGMEKPLWFHEVKAHLVKDWGAIEVDGLEADDIVCIIKNNLENSFIIAADKDILDCIPGKHFDARKGKVSFIETTKEEAALNFAKSLLTGDSVDGVPNLIKGMGPKTAETELLKRMEFNNTLISAQQIFIYHLGEYEGIKRFARQYQLLKIIDSLEQLPKDITFVMPVPLCYNCVETLMSEDVKQNLGWDYSQLDAP